MTKKIFYAIFSVCTLVFLSSMILTFSTLFQYFSSVEKDQLHSSLELAAQGYDQEGLRFLEDMDHEDYRVSLISAMGNVLYDSSTGSDTLPSHADREEVKEALETGWGESTRYSETLTEQAIYSAMKLPDGNVLRISVSRYSVLTLLMGVATPLISIFCGALLAALVLAIWLSHRIMSPLENLDLDHPEQGEIYEEMKPIADRLSRYRRDLDRQKRRLRVQQAEFDTVAAGIEEGLLLLDQDLNILYLNEAAAAALDLAPGAAQKIQTEIGAGKEFPFDRLCLLEPVVDLARKARKSGQPQNALVPVEDRVWLVQAGPVIAREKFRGESILLLDVTERQQMERMRKEFTGNVSHELKTPLQTISGYSELMAQGLARPEDVQGMAERILREARRMSTQVDQILTLTRMDEGLEVKREAVNLNGLIGSVQADVQETASRSRVSVTVQEPDAPVVVQGNPQLLRSVVFNLTENAIKYSAPDSHVQLTLRRDPGEAVLLVSDDGPGIAPADQERIFERFYRVDKSRSRQLGGTGLGLAIVKNAVRLHGGTVSVDSEPGKGSVFTVRLPVSETGDSGEDTDTDSMQAES
ncbi:ATP-binding protein [uncultured Faecalibaculum sp.]|uniref:sensor histidine kinase n=3 Tax=uncultured Faecalibaculum sp. TaxID=1729681 RepID=UPI00262CAD5A|nr:ATP-binding protein [uncultured Faecalibaculum sp.]